MFRIEADEDPVACSHEALCVLSGGPYIAYVAREEFADLSDCAGPFINCGNPEEVNTLERGVTSIYTQRRFIVPP